MSKSKMAINRLVTFIVAVVFGLICAWAIGEYLNQNWADDAGRNVQHTVGETVPQSGNYDIIMLAVALGCAVIGLVIIVMNIERRRVGKKNLAHSQVDGVLTVHAGDIARAAAEELERNRGVRVTTHIATVDRGQRVMQFVIRANSTVDVAALRAACRQTAEDIVAATPGMNFAPRFRLEVERVAE